MIYLWGEQDSNLRRWNQRIYSPSSLAAWVSPQPYKVFSKKNEPMEGFEPTTCWLQISCSGQLSYIGNFYFFKVNINFSSRWRDSNPRPADYKSAALANWATSAICGESRIRTCEGETNGFTVRPRWPLEYLPNLIFLLSRWRDSNPRPADYKSAALANWATSAKIFFFEMSNWKQEL